MGDDRRTVGRVGPVRRGRVRRREESRPTCSCSVTASPSSGTRPSGWPTPFPCWPTASRPRTGTQSWWGVCGAWVVQTVTSHWGVGTTTCGPSSITPRVIGNGGGVWIVGFGTGGALGLCVAGEDSRVRGVACFGSPATFADWANEGVGMIEYARRVGAISSAGFPSDRRQWAAAFACAAARRVGGQVVAAAPARRARCRGRRGAHRRWASPRRVRRAGRRVAGPGRSWASLARRPPRRCPPGGVVGTSGALIAPGPTWRASITRRRRSPRSGRSPPADAPRRIADRLIRSGSGRRRSDGPRPG